MAEDDLFAAHRSLIESVLALSCRMHRLSADEGGEFCAWAQLRLLDHEQGILRKFAGRSSIRTFLVTVIERLFLDWRNHEWGKWRPSSEARRQGAVAIELERLVLRDGCALGEAIHVLVGRGLAADERECLRAWERLPRRPRRQRVDEEQLAEHPAPALDTVDAAERRQQRAELLRALESAIAALPAADQSLLRLRYWGAVPVSRLAVMTGEEQKPLYRRFERILRDLRIQLKASGVEADLGDMFEGFDPDEGRVDERDDVPSGAPRSGLPIRPATTAEGADLRPSHLTRAGGTHG